MRCHLLCLVACFSIATLPSTGPAWSQDADPSRDPDRKKRSQQLFDHFDETAKALEIVASQSRDRLTWRQSPLFRFSSEGTVFGSVYVWHDASSRLAAVGTIGSIPINANDVEFIELHLLMPTPIEPLRFPGRDGKRWQPDVSDLSLRAIIDSPAVAKTATARMIQMRGLARRFSADMISGQQTNQLRLLPQPIYRYEDSTPELDGALFAFVWDKGTDPELLLRLEVVADADDGKSRWHYQPVRFSWRELNLRLADMVVWDADELVDRNRPLQTTPYVTGLTEAIP